MKEKFLSHHFNKICTENRGCGEDALIHMAVSQNAERLSDLINSNDGVWIRNFLDVEAMFFALSQLQEYYSGGTVTHEEWVLAGNYAHTQLKNLDSEMMNN